MNAKRADELVPGDRFAYGIVEYEVIETSRSRDDGTVQLLLDSGDHRPDGRRTSIRPHAAQQFAIETRQASVRNPDLTAYDIAVTTTAGGGLIADVRDLPGCVAAGDNVEELTVALREAIVLHHGDYPDAPAHYEQPS